MMMRYMVVDFFEMIIYCMMIILIILKVIEKVV